MTLEEIEHELWKIGIPKDLASADRDVLMNGIVLFRRMLTERTNEFEAALAREAKLVEALKSARGWVSTHAMQTYSSVASKEVEEIDYLLNFYPEPGGPAHPNLNTHPIDEAAEDENW